MSHEQSEDADEDDEDCEMWNCFCQTIKNTTVFIWRTEVTKIKNKEKINYSINK